MKPVKMKLSGSDVNTVSYSCCPADNLLEELSVNVILGLQISEK